MRIPYLIGWLLVVIILFFIVCKVTSSKIYGKILWFIVILLLWLGGSSVIKLNTLPQDTWNKVQEVTEVCGDTYIRVEGNDIYINVNDSWLNLEEVGVVGSLLTEELYLEYDGKQIYVGNTGLVNTLKVLDSVGLIDSE